MPFLFSPLWGLCSSPKCGLLSPDLFTTITFWWLQALGTRGLEPSKGPFNHLLVLHLHSLASVTFVTVMASWKQLPSTAAGHLEGNKGRDRLDDR